MDAFAKAAGIDAEGLSYIVIPTLVIIVIAALVIGLNHMLIFLRLERLSPTDFLRGVLRSVMAVIMIVALVYFLY